MQAGEPVIKVSPQWKSKIRSLAPDLPSAKPKAKRKILVFSLMTGYHHWVTPNTAAMIKILGEKSGAYETVDSIDVEMFSVDKLKAFDAVILNNTCSKPDHRNLFMDARGAEKSNEVRALEDSLISFVKSGKGLIVIHAGITTFNGCPEIVDMFGGTFDFHPPQQPVTLYPVEAGHPLVKAFGGKSFVHIDEPYMFNGACKKNNSRPLLVMDTTKLKCGRLKKKVMSEARYVSWIKSYGKGRVFFCSPSHNAQSFSDPRLLRFYLDGFQYALGDLDCDDSPIHTKHGKAPTDNLVAD